jgi:hypothetical protein
MEEIFGKKRSRIYIILNGVHVTSFLKEWQSFGITALEDEFLVLQAGSYAIGWRRNITTDFM